MSRTSQVIKNKNRVEKLRKDRRRNEMVSLRNNSAFKAKLYAELQHVDAILEDNDVDALILTVPDKSLAQFSSCIYTEDLAGYNIEQVDGQSNQFYIRRKSIDF